MITPAQKDPRMPGANQLPVGKGPTSGCDSSPNTYLSEYYEEMSNQTPVRDWSFITGRGGGLPMKITGRKFIAPTPQDRVQLFASLLLKSGSAPPPFNMAKTSSYCVKTTPKLFVPPPPTPQHG